MLYITKFNIISKKIAFFIVFFVFASCAVTKDYKLAVLDNTINSYESHLSNYPKSRYKKDVIKRLDILYEQIYLPAWNNAKSKNTYNSYKEFISQFPKSVYSDSAKTKLFEIEEAEWDKVKQSDTKELYKDFILNFPNNSHNDFANKRIIDIEVDEIFKGDHGKLPPLVENNSKKIPRDFSEIKLKNDTEYIIIVRYSGIESKKISMDPGETRTITLKNGKYKIAASAQIVNVRDYYGEDFLNGSNYSGSFYIKRK